MPQSPTFHTFPRLPTELQIIILTSATPPCYIPRGICRKWQTTEHQAFNHIRYSIVNYWHLVTTRASASPTHSSTVTPNHDELRLNLLTEANINGFQTRVSRMGTCRLGRLVALEAWKEDYSSHSARVLADEEVDDEHLMAGKAAMVRFLDKVIVELTGKMRG